MPVIFASPDAPYPPFVAIVTTLDRLYAISSSTLHAFDISNGVLMFSAKIYNDLGVAEGQLQLQHLRSPYYNTIIVVGTISDQASVFVEYDYRGKIVKSD